MNQKEALAMIEHFGRSLTKRQREALRLMESDPDGGYYERGRFYVDLEAFSATTFNALLAACAISPDQYGSDSASGEGYYHVNETGRRILAASTPAGPGE